MRNYLCGLDSGPTIMQVQSNGLLQLGGYDPIKTLRNGKFEDFCLGELWKKIKATNNSGSDENYHSNRHMFEVFYIAMWLAINNGHHFTLSAAIACLMHDYNHSLGASSDDENIDAAIEGVYLLCKGNLSFTQMEEVGNLIRLTRFPFLPENEPKSIIEACIRDADILYAMTRNDTQRYEILKKLYKEQKWELEYMDVMFNKQRDFWKSCTMYTIIGQNVRDWYIKEKM